MIYRNKYVVLKENELEEIIKKAVEKALTKGEQDTQQTKEFTQERYVFGLRGIRELFNVSHATAQRYKDTILKPAVKQFGRKIIVDREMALKLFAEKGGV